MWALYRCLRYIAVEAGHLGTFGRGEEKKNYRTGRRGENLRHPKGKMGKVGHRGKRNGGQHERKTIEVLAWGGTRKLRSIRVVGELVRLCQIVAPGRGFRWGQHSGLVLSMWGRRLTYKWQF